LAGLAAAAMIKGIEKDGIVATIKHFVCNDQEHGRICFDALVTQRALREIYLQPFQIAVRESNPGAFMTSYNKLNGVHVSESRLLEDTLRGEWAWTGLVMSDWFVYLPALHADATVTVQESSHWIIGSEHTQLREPLTPV
jgi:beta-glucosidase